MKKHLENRSVRGCLLFIMGLALILNLECASQRKTGIACGGPNSASNSKMELFKAADAKRNTKKYNNSLRAGGMKKAKNASGEKLYKGKDKKIVKRPVVVDKKALFGVKKPEDEIK